MDRLLLQVLLQAAYTLKPNCNMRGKIIRNPSCLFYDWMYKTHLDSLLFSVRDWFKATGEDQTNERFRRDWARLTKEVSFHSEESLNFKAEL
jgi:hypothetical protein